MLTARKAKGLNSTNGPKDPIKMKTLISALALSAVLATSAAAQSPASVVAAKPDPAPTTPAEALSTCLVNRARLREATTLADYEAVRFSQQNYFYIGSRVWFSQGTDTASGAVKACLDAAGAK